MGVTQGMHVRPILADPGVYLISFADGPVAGDEDIDIARHALEQPQRGKVVLDRVRGAVQVEHRNQDIRKHVAGDENPAFLNQQLPQRCAHLGDRATLHREDQAEVAAAAGTAPST